MKEPAIIIAGAGPAGVATAVAAIRADPSLRGRVVIIDRATFPRGKPCGGGLTGHIDEAMSALGLVLDVASISSPRALVRYGSQTREVTLGRPVRVVRREEFDQSLVEQAIAMGVEVRERTALTGYEVEGDGVRVHTSAGELRARVLVGADGAGSLVRKALSGRRRMGSPGADVRAGDLARGRPGPGARPIRMFRAELPDRAWHRTEMLYDFTPMVDGLRGYLWIFPVPGGLINVGVMHDPHVARSGAELTALLTRRLADHGVSLDGATLRGWPAWGYLPGQEVSSPHVLAVGDAAGIDALTGEGISVAMEQGIIAGQAAASALSSGNYRFSGYRRALRVATVGRELSLDRWLAALLYRGVDHRRWLSLVFSDEAMLQLYAARVSGSMVLADHKRLLVGALARHLVQGRARVRSLRAAEGPSTLC